jgi:hypothetical protein
VRLRNSTSKYVARAYQPVRPVAAGLSRGSTSAVRSPSSFPRTLQSFKTALTAIAAALLASCNEAPNEHVWRQKLTVEVDTPDGPRSGSSVVEVIARLRSEANTSGELIETSLVGEAAVVRITDKRLLIAMLSGDHLPTQERMIWSVFGDTLQRTGKPMDFKTLGSLIESKPKKTLLPEQFPLLLTFENNHDFDTATAIKSSDMLSRFGPGITLKKVVLAITDAPVSTSAIETDLVELVWHTKHGQDPTRRMPICGVDDPSSPDKFCWRLTGRDFKRTNHIE